MQHTDSTASRSVPSRTTVPGAGRSRRALLAAALVVPLVGVAACSGSSSSGSSSSSSAAAGFTSSSGVKVVGAYGAKPTVTPPSGKPPATLQSEVITAGKGAAVASGQTVVANYLGQTWDPKAGKPNVFDNSFDRKQVFAFTLGAGGVISGWQKGLAGKTLGSRVLLTVPPADGYGTAANAQNELAGKELIFVVDIVDTVPSNTSASGSAGPALPAGYPKVTSSPGRPATITSVAGVKKVTAPESALLIKGDGAKIDPTKSLLVQLTSTDAATGKKTQTTYGGQGPIVLSGAQVLGVASAAKDQNLGSRVVMLTPATQAAPAGVYLMDIIRQY